MNSERLSNSKCKKVTPFQKWSPVVTPATESRSEYIQPIMYAYEKGKCTLMWEEVYGYDFIEKSHSFLKHENTSYDSIWMLLNSSKSHKLQIRKSVYNRKMTLFFVLRDAFFFQKGTRKHSKNTDFSSYIFFKKVQKSDNRHLFCQLVQIG